MTDPTPPAELPPRPPTSWRYRAVVAVALALAATALVVGVRATQTEDDGTAVVSGRPDVVEHLYPRDGAEVLRQVEIGIDLAPGYAGRLVVGEEAVPEDELRLVPEQNQVFFLPGPGKVLETLPPGPTCVTAIVWRSADGPGVADLTFRWCFDVT